MKTPVSNLRHSAWAWLSSVWWLTAARLLVGVVGLALLILGADRFSVAVSDAGAITLVIAGAVLLLSPFVLDRVQRVSVSASSEDLWLTTQVSERGAPETATILQRTRLGSFAESYGPIHDELTAPDYKAARIHLQDLLVQRAAGVVRHEKFEAKEVRRLFANGSVVMRALALGLMQGGRSLADASTITSAVIEGRSRNEQYQGLRLTRLCWPRLPLSDRREIRRAIEQAEMEPGSDRWQLAQEVLSLPYS